MSMRSASEDRPSETAIRERRAELARRNSNWTELEETALVRRGPYLVHADTDELFTRYRSLVFETGSAGIIFQELAPMHFYVDRAGEIVFLERKPGTWSEIVAKRARRTGAAA